MPKKETKKECPITRTQFNSDAPKGSSVLDKISENIQLSTRHFSTGSFGWFGNGKMAVRVGDEIVKCQVAVTVTVVNSKNAKDGESEREAA